MTGPGFQLDTAAAAAAVRAYDDSSDQARSTIQQMLGDVDALRATRYAGRQAQALDRAVEGLDGDLKKLVQLLSDLSSVVNSTQTAYTETDDSVAQSLTSAAGGAYDRLRGN
ncbi:WXG100 family type VII secretion target [Hamadaea flava]|uniref:WXG100 family type VII secretion target n=1 Tax=Hamadaea flava TaxID=1742688 RepID=A0ABV8LX52_9ACTN|nr:WXG100 family type VII secretion target [Hamadaea flava]MCP2321609.1 WXG100 family type VII secretion target [Hamadaea flava]